MNALSEKQASLEEEFQLFSTIQERIGYLIERAETLPELPANLRKDEFLIEGCLSQIWLVPRFENGKCYFDIDSDAVITKAIAGLLADFYSGLPPEEIANHSPDFLEQYGINQHLTPNRRYGLSNVFKTIHSYALHFLRHAKKC